MRNLVILLVVGIMVLSLPTALGQNLLAAQDSDATLNSKIMKSLTQSYNTLISSLDGLSSPDALHDDGKPHKKKKEEKAPPPPKSKASLGVYIQESDDGVRIINLTDPSPAKKAGVKVEDLVLAANGKRIKAITDLQDVMKKVTPGEVVNLVVKRGDEKVKCHVKTHKTAAVYNAPAEEKRKKVKELKADSQKFKELKKFLKNKKSEAADEDEDVVIMEFKDGQKIIKHKGDKKGKASLGVMIDGSSGKVRVVDMPKNSPAKKAGVKIDDIIIAANGKEIKEMEDLTKVMAKVKPGKTVNLIVARNGKKVKAKVHTGDSVKVFGDSLAVTALEDHPHAHAKTFDIKKHVYEHAHKSECHEQECHEKEHRAGAIHELLKKHLHGSGDCGDCSSCEEECHVFKLGDGKGYKVWTSKEGNCDASDCRIDFEDFDFDVDCGDGKCIVKKMKLPGKERNYEIIICTDEDEECFPAKGHHKVMKFGGHGKKYGNSCCSCCCSCNRGRSGNKNNEIIIKIEISGCGQVNYDVWHSKGDCRKKMKKSNCHGCGCDKHKKSCHSKAKKMKIYKSGCGSSCGHDKNCNENVWIFDCDEKP